MEGRQSMTREEFLKEMDDILGLAPGTLKGNEKLEELENWDSTSMISLVALAETNNNVEISPEQIITCTTVEDLLRIAQIQVGVN
jgi:acyl carrier protein